MLWSDEQRGIGELMAGNPSDSSTIVCGYAGFQRDHDRIFIPRMERFSIDLCSYAAVTSQRLRILQWALYGLVRRLDEEGAYAVGRIDQSAVEIRQWTPQENITQHEEQLMRRLTTT